jgi:endonuclease YncB( thermonuclease family)
LPGGILPAVRRAFHNKLSSPQRRFRYTGRKLVAALVLASIMAAIPAADRLGLFGHAQARDHDKYDGKTFRVVHVVDGDTLDVDATDDVRHKPTTRIRLWGIDTPEVVDPRKPVEHFGPEASAFAKSLAANALVRLDLDATKTRDKYDRLLAYIVLPDGRMLNRVLVEEGYAYADPRYPHKYKREFEKLMKHAKTAGKGLWKDVRPNDLPYYLQNEKLPEP